MSYNERNSGSGSIWGVVLGVLVVIIITTLLLSVRVVDVAKSCAWVRFGKIVGTAQPGMQLVVPLTRAVCYPRQSILFQTAQDADNNGKVNSEADYYDFPVEIKTEDGQSAMLEFNLTFHVEPDCAVQIRSEIASNTDDLVMRVINNFSRSIPRDLAPTYSAKELYGKDRVLFETEIRNSLLPLFSENCVALDAFILRDINFDQAYEDIMEQKQIQMEGVTVQKFVADQAVENARATVTNAKAAADAQIETARGQAETTRLMAIAEADAMEVKGKALQLYPEMVQLKFFDALGSANWSLIPWDSVGGYMPLPVTP